MAHTVTHAHHPETIPWRAGGAPGGRAGASGEAPEEDILATIAALERQTRFSTGGSEDASAAGPSGACPPQMDEAAYQAMLSQARGAWPCGARARSRRARVQFEQMGADPAVTSLLDSMMAQLLSKDVLYEPLQQISARVRPAAVFAPALASFGRE